MTAERGIVVIGAGGHGMVVCDIIEATQPGLVMGFADENAAMHGSRVLDLPVIGTVEAVIAQQGVRTAMGIGDNGARRRQYERLNAAGLEVITAIHPTAVISARATVGSAVVVMANAVVNVAADIRENVIINTAASIDHHCVVGAHSHVAPGVTLAGNVRVGEETLVGAGAVVLPGVTIGNRCTIGAGSVVVNDVPDGVTVVGAPARAVAGV